MERLALTLLVLACFVLVLWGMRVGWLRKARAQSARIPPFPQVPDEPGEPVLESRGLYVSTTTAGNWQDRIVARGVGLRGRASLRLYPGGIEVDRDGAVGFWIPRESIVDLKLGAAIAGKVMGPGGLLLITWRAGEMALDTGFRADDPNEYPLWTESPLIKGGAG